MRWHHWEEQAKARVLDQEVDVSRAVDTMLKDIVCSIFARVASFGARMAKVAMWEKRKEVTRASKGLGDGKNSRPGSGMSQKRV